MKYKVGDKVKIREDLHEGYDYKLYCSDEETTVLRDYDDDDENYTFDIPYDADLDDLK